MIHYRHDVETIRPAALTGFFEGWENPPSSETHLRILKGSDAVVVALDDDPEPRVVGFATAITDGVLATYIPLLEVLPVYRGRGIGRELVRRLLASLGDLYMIDLICDPDLLPFYTSLGFKPATGAVIRRMADQAGIQAVVENNEPSL